MSLFRPVMEVGTTEIFAEETARHYFIDLVLGIEYCENRDTSNGKCFDNVSCCSALPEGHSQRHKAIQSVSNRRWASKGIASSRVCCSYVLARVRVNVRHYSVGLNIRLCSICVVQLVGNYDV